MNKITQDYSTVTNINLFLKSTGAFFEVILDLWALILREYIGILKTQIIILLMGAQWLSGRVLDSRPRGGRFKPHQRHCVVVLEQDTFILALYWFNPGRPVSF